jgi:hypothetical protein
MITSRRLERRLVLLVASMLTVFLCFFAVGRVTRPTATADETSSHQHLLALSVRGGIPTGLTVEPPIPSLLPGLVNPPTVKPNHVGSAARSREAAAGTSAPAAQALSPTLPVPTPASPAPTPTPTPAPAPARSRPHATPRSGSSGGNGGGSLDSSS